MRTTLISLFMLLNSSLFAAPYSALKDGEFFRYKAGWGIFGNAGEITVSSKKDTFNGRDIIRVVMTTATKGFVRGVFHYEDRAEALIDIETGQIIQATDLAHNGDKHTDATALFDYASRRVSYVDKARPDKSRDFDIPEGNPIDLISALIGAREWAREAGTKREALIFAGRDVYPVTITAEAFETIRFDGDDIRTLKLTPRMEKCPPRGVFKKGGEIKVWVAQQDSFLPVRMQLKLPVGTATLTLVQYSRPAPAPKE